MWENLKKKFKESVIGNFIIRNMTWVVIIAVTNIVLWLYYKALFWNVVFACIVASEVMALALVWANISVFVFTKLHLDDDIHPILGQIFMGTCIVISIVYTFTFWTKLGG